MSYLKLADLRKQVETEALGKAIRQIYADAQLVTENIIADNAVDQRTYLATLHQELNVEIAALLGNDMVKKSKTPDEGVFIYKQKDNLYRWLGIHTNKYHDGIHILSNRAHLKFVDMLHKGIEPFPELRFCHEPVAVGEVDLVGYNEDAGAMFSSGTFNKDYQWMAEFIQSTPQFEWSMSHGMPKAKLEFDPADSRVINTYVSTEETFLPKWLAQNKLTEFVVYQE